MKSINRVTLAGHLGLPPEMVKDKNGDAFARLSIATNYKNGENEKTDWHKVRVWGSKAKYCEKNLSKGDPIVIEGYLSSYKYQDEAGNTQKVMTINSRDIFVQAIPGTKE